MKDEERDGLRRQILGKSHFFTACVSKDGSVGASAHHRIEVVVMSAVKHSAGRFTVTLPHSPERAMLIVETAPVLPTNGAGKSVMRVSSSEDGDVWDIYLDRLTVDWSGASAEPFDSGFDIMLVWEDQT